MKKIILLLPFLVVGVSCYTQNARDSVKKGFIDACMEDGFTRNSCTCIHEYYLQDVSWYVAVKNCT